MITCAQQNPQFVSRFNGYAHQTAVLNQHWSDKHYALFWEMGLGKTKTTIEMAVKLYLAGEIDGVLIIAPKCAYLNWIAEEIGKHVPESVRYRVGYYSAYSTNKSRTALERVMAAEDNTLDFMAINIEAVATIHGFHNAVRFARSHYTLCVIDESSKIKSPNAKRTKAAIQIGRECDYRRILSGTPITRNPLDLWTQLEFLGFGLSGHRSFFSFRNYYAQIINIQAGNRTFPKIAGFRNMDELSALLARCADRRLKSECLDLPEKVFETVYVEWTPEQARVYNALRTQALVEFDQGTVSSTSALTTLMRLHQINCGHVKDDDGHVRLLDSNRLSTLMDLVEDMPGKVIIWARFRHDIQSIAGKLAEEYGERSRVLYYGGTNDVEKLDAMRAFKHDPTCRFFVANPASAGMSITLTEATTAIYYSLSYSLEEWLQSQDRNHRIGQKNKVTYFTLAVNETVDTRLLRALQTKTDLAASVLDNFRQMLAI